MEELYNVLNRYFEVLSKTGYIPIKSLEGIFVLDFIKELLEDPDFVLMATCEEQKIADKLYDCVKHNNCLV